MKVKYICNASIKYRSILIEKGEKVVICKSGLLFLVIRIYDRHRMMTFSHKRFNHYFSKLEAT